MTVRVLPVIHHLDEDRSVRNAAIAAETGCDGVLLIHMQGRDRLLPPVARTIRDRWPGLVVGVNRLCSDPMEALEEDLADGFAATWTDGQPTHSAERPWSGAEAISRVLAKATGHLMFAGVAFKHQRDEPDAPLAATTAIRFGLVPTTSGPATGVPPDPSRVAALRAAIGPDAPLAVASGLSPDNAASFAPHITHAIVATGVSSSFHDLDPDLLRRFVAACRLVS